MRRVLPLLALALLAASAGCTAFGGGSVDEEKLTAGVDHDWNTTADATVILEKNRYRAVFHVSGTRTIELYRPRRFNNREPIDPIGLDFRYPNGTVVDLTTARVERSGGATVVTLPARNGSVAFEARRQGKTIRLPTVVNGSYEVVLPRGGRVAYPFLGRVIPRGYTTSTDADGRVHVRWDAPDRDLIVVEYYLARDLLILGGIVAVGAVALLGGAAYFLVTIRKLRRRREEVDVEGRDPG